VLSAIANTWSPTEKPSTPDSSRNIDSHQLRELNGIGVFR
jgi:hypothetical protein